MAGRVLIGSVASDDDFRSDYVQLVDAREGASLEAWADNLTAPEEPEPATEPEPVEPNAERGMVPEGEREAVTPGNIGAAIERLGKETTDRVTVRDVASDVGQGLVESVPQAFGGAMDALHEVDQALQSVLPVGGLRILDDDGNVDLGFVGQEEYDRLEGRDGSFFEALATEEADSVTGGIVRAGAQFLTGFVPALKGLKAAGAASTGIKGAGTALGAGAISDAVAHDPHQERLSTFLNEVPALADVVPDYLAANGPEVETELEGRLKNAIEGAGLGVMADGLLGAFKFYKIARRERAVKREAEAGAPDMQREAARETMREAAREEIADDITDEQLAALGDADAPLVVKGSEDDTAETAFTRVREAGKRAELHETRRPALEAIRDAQDLWQKRAPGTDTFDQLLNDLRRGRANNADRGPARPVANIVKALGGIDPASSIAGELRNIGVTARTHPGLYRKGGLGALDNVPLDEHPIFRMLGEADDGNGYVAEAAFVEGMRRELAGDPLRTQEQLDLISDEIAPLESMNEQLERLGLDLDTMSNRQVRDRLDAIAEEEAAYLRSLEPTPEPTYPDGFDPDVEADPNVRSADDLAQENAAIDGAGGFDGPRPVPGADVPKGRVFINHARINAPDDVRAVIQQMADADEEFIDAKRRGVVSNQQTIKESSQEYRDLDDLLGRPPGPMSAAEAVAARRLLTSSAEQLVALAKKASAPEASKADVYAFRRGMSVHYAIQSEVIAARTETARALQSWSIPAGASDARSKLISEMIEESGGAGNLRNLARGVAMMDGNEVAVNTAARELGKGKFGAALYQVWINGLLSSPKTHAVNILSNAITSVWAVPERMMASGISRAFYDGEIPEGEAAAMAFGMMKGVRDGVRLAVAGDNAENVEGLADLFDGFVKVENMHENSISGSAFGRENGWIGRGIDGMGAVLNVPGAMLGKEDAFFKSIGYRMELQARAFREAASEGLEGREFAERVIDVLRNPPEDLKADALDFAHVQTFTNPLGKFGQAFQKIVGIPRVNGLPFMRLIVPFIKTPTNILKFTLTRTPVAYMAESVRADVRAGGARAAQAHARVAMGTMLMMTVADMTTEGTVTGSGPTDWSQNSAKRMTGWQPYSVKIGDRYYAYNRLDPIGMIMGLAADTAEILANTDGVNDDSEMLLGAVTLALANNLSSKTYTQGIYDFIAAIDSQNPMSSPQKYVEGFVGSLSPYSSLARNVAQVMDPTIRDARALVIGDDGEPDRVATFLQGMVNKTKRGIPGLSDDLPPVRDFFGEPLDRRSGFGIAFDFLSPIASKEYKGDEVVDEMLASNFRPSKPNRAIMGVKLTPEEYDEYSELTGKRMRVEMDRLVANPDFKRASDGDGGLKQLLFGNVASAVRKQAAGEMLQRHPKLREAVNRRRAKDVQKLQGVE